MRISFRKILEDIGPVLAGFQISVSIVGFFSIGAFASWIIENWLPFTRWIWTECLSRLNLPQITDFEKDALTTIAFFTPMAISAILNRNIINDEKRLFRTRIYALILGVIFMYLVGNRVVVDMLSMMNSFDVNAFIGSAQEPIYKRPIYLLNFVLMPIMLVPAMYFYYHKYKGILIKTRKSEEYDEEDLRNRRRKLLRNTNNLVLAIGLSSFLFTGIYLATEGLGIIRAFAPLIVVGCLAISVLLHPSRLLNTAGVVVAFVGSSIGWEIAAKIVNTIETLPK